MEKGNQKHVKITTNKCFFYKISQTTKAIQYIANKKQLKKGLFKKLISNFLYVFNHEITELNLVVKIQEFNENF
jgi:hypothetical protein